MKRLKTYALVSLLLICCSGPHEEELIFVEPGNDDNFNYPYFLFIPKHTSQKEKVFVVVEPNNSGFVDDDLQKHIDNARLIATKDFYLGNYAARELAYPLLVPVFPRPETEWQIYTHDLDRDVMLQKNNALERIDKQLIEMFEDARARLESKNIKAQSRFLLTGFSAAGSFANRFALIHPEKVFAVAAGGTSGLLMLPLDSLDNEFLKFPIGVGDLKALTGKAFQRKPFLKTPQLYFMGKLDTNDSTPYNDAFDPKESEQIYRLLGEQMLPERWDRCKKIYKSSHVNAIIETYEKVGHEHPERVKKAIVAFFKECINPKPGSGTN